jgi:hypothetical protein
MPPCTADPGREDQVRRAQAASESREIHRSGTSKPWVQLLAGVVGMMMISSLQYAWTLFVPSFTGTFKWSLPAVQLALTLFIIFMIYLAPLTGYLMDRFGTRRGPGRTGGLPRLLYGVSEGLLVAHDGHRHHLHDLSVDRLLRPGRQYFPPGTNIYECYRNI